MTAKITSAGAAGEMIAVQIDHQGDTAKEALEHFFLVVPHIISKGTHEGRSIPRDAVFVLQKVDGVISMYDRFKKQVGNDRTSWDIYARALSDDGSASVVFYAVEGQSGSHVGQFEIEKDANRCHWLLHHMEQDRIGRANLERSMGFYADVPKRNSHEDRQILRQRLKRSRGFYADMPKRKKRRV